MGLTKAGAGTLTLASANTYTGVTTLNGGTLVVPTLANGGVISSIGQSSSDSASLVFNGGTLHYTGPSVVLDRGFTNHGGGIQIDNDLTIAGLIASTTTNYRPITYKTGAGTLTFKTPGDTATTHNFGYDVSYNELWIQQGKTVFDGVTGTEYKSWWVNVGVDPVGVYNQGGPATVGTPELDINNVTLSTGALGWGYGGKAVVKMTGTSKVNVAAYALIGYATPNTVTQTDVTMSDTAAITTVGNFLLGCQGANTTGNLTLNTDATITVGGATYLGANNATAAATTVMNNNTFIKSTGILYVGYNGAASNLTMRNDSHIDGKNGLYFGLTGKSIVELHDNSHITSTTGNFINGANSPTASASLTLYDASYITTPGIAYIGSNALGNATLSGTSYIQAGSHVYIGNSSNGASTLTMNGIGTNGPHITSTAGNIYVGSNFTGALFGNGTATMTGGSAIACTDATNGIFLVGYNKGVGSLTQSGTSTITARRIYYGEAAGAIGTVIMNDNAVTTASADLLLGYSSATGTLTLNQSASMSIGTIAYVGAYGGTGTVNLNGPTAQFAANSIQVGYNWNAVATDTHGTFNVNGANALVNADTIIVGADGGQGAVWNQNSGHTTAVSKLYVGEYDGTDAAAGRTAGSGTLNLNGGTVTTPVVSTHSVYSAEIIGPSSGTVNFNGGILQASASSADFIATDDSSATMTLNVQKNATTGLGALIDTQAFDVTITKNLVHDAAGPAIDGGLKKIGTGSLTLTGALSYTGNTAVNAGTLNVTALNTPNATVSVATGANLTATSIVANTLSIGGAPTASVAAVPEPTTLVLLMLAGAGILLAAWRRK
jgi:fibronectin-binding autotransporter adhesin